MIYLFLLIGILMLISITMLMKELSFPQKLEAISLNKVVYENINNSVIQFGKTNVSSLNYNSTQMTNATSSTTPQEIHKPLSPKSPQEIEREKQEIQKSKANVTVFTQRLRATS
jgi:hypothetical protein